MKKTILGISLCAFQALHALTFGNMGNTSAGLGDSGVALRKSAWGIYYNPALLASDNRGKFGYSFGAGIDQRGLGDMFASMLGGGGEIDINALYNQINTNPNNSLAISSQNGIVMQITGGTREVPKLDEEGNPTDEMVEVRSPVGAFTIAAFLSVFGSGKIETSLGNLQALELNSQLSAKGNLDGLILLEVPVGWGWRFETSGGDISIGAAIKYMGASAINFDLIGDINQNGDTHLNFTKQIPSLASMHSFGIDLGILYSIYGFNVGVVAKNINVPTFNHNGQKFKIDPQFRLGLSYEFAQYFALTFDSDLAPNSFLFSGSQKTQTLGGGLLMDFKYIDLRFGLMGDMANKFDNGVIMTGGINLLGFLDIAVQASSKMFKFEGYKIPNMFNIKVGGSFTF